MGSKISSNFRISLNSVVFLQEYVLILLLVAFSLTRDVFFSREDVNLHGKEKEKVYAYLHPQHLAQLGPGEDLKEAEQGRGHPECFDSLFVPLCPGSNAEDPALGLP